MSVLRRDGHTMVVTECPGKAVRGLPSVRVMIAMKRRLMTAVSAAWLVALLLASCGGASPASDRSDGRTRFTQEGPVRARGHVVPRLPLGDTTRQRSELADLLQQR